MGAADVALQRLIERSSDGRLSLAGCFALGYCTVALAQSEGGPDWFDDVDPLDLLVLGGAFPANFMDAAEFGNARAEWLRRIKGSPFQGELEAFVRLAVDISNEASLPVDHPELFRRLARKLESVGLDRVSLPAELRLEALSDARFLRGPSLGLIAGTPSSNAVVRAETILSDLSIRRSAAGTCGDRLAEGLYLLETLGQPVRAHSQLLLVALYSTVVASDEESIPDIPERAHAWGLGLDEASPLAAFVDVIMAASARDLDVTTTIAHLTMLPAFDQPIASQDQPWRSGPGLDFARVALDLGCREVVTTRGRAMRLGPVATHVMASQLRESEDGPAPSDYVISDPVETAGAWAEMFHKAGFHPAWIFAYIEGNAPLPRPDGKFASKSDHREWRNAISAYMKLHPEIDFPDHDEEVARLRNLLGVMTLGEVVSNPGLPLQILSLLDDEGYEDETEEIAILVELLLSWEETLRALFAGSQLMRERAVLLARSWGGEELASRLTAMGEVSDPAALLVLAAASVTAREPASTSKRDRRSSKKAKVNRDHAVRRQVVRKPREG